MTGRTIFSVQSINRPITEDALEMAMVGLMPTLMRIIEVANGHCLVEQGQVIMADHVRFAVTTVTGHSPPSVRRDVHGSVSSPDSL